MLSIFDCVINQFAMQLGEKIKRVREAQGLSQKEVALSCKMDPAQYSRIENGKGDPAYSTLVKIAKALKVELADLLKAHEVFKEVSSLDKSVIEKVSLIEQLDKKEKLAFYSVLDAFIGKKKLKDALGNVLQSVE